ncbi:hypothetical protein T08_7636 [Trichinella sp. T8]|nr:hypothetical protein T08_11145 [Trichinella sp. T8]KRZ89766.1 hypothetical protein T08_7636 [Trichinella sp. T8]
MGSKLGALPIIIHRKVAHLHLPPNGTRMQQQLYKSTVENILIYIGVEQKSRSTCSFSPQYHLQFQKWSVNNVVRDECTMESMRIFLNNFGVLPLHNPLSNILSNSLSKIPRTVQYLSNDYQAVSVYMAHSVGTFLGFDIF